MRHSLSCAQLQLEGCWVRSFHEKSGCLLHHAPLFAADSHVRRIESNQSLVRPSSWMTPSSRKNTSAVAENCHPYRGIVVVLSRIPLASFISFLASLSGDISSPLLLSVGKEPPNNEILAQKLHIAPEIASFLDCTGSRGMGPAHLLVHLCSLTALLENGRVGYWPCI